MLNFLFRHLYWYWTWALGLVCPQSSHNHRSNWSQFYIVEVFTQSLLHRVPGKDLQLNKHTGKSRKSHGIIWGCLLARLNPQADSFSRHHTGTHLIFKIAFQLLIFLFIGLLINIFIGEIWFPSGSSCRLVPIFCDYKRETRNAVVFSVLENSGYLDISLNTFK